ncbi:hypothetical protein U879_10580 [Defluviimonas sp. 20V17]|uniref:Undecaprenyl-diphosphatase n=1 Tax=Allgaiera indica TaxID=765699 RepID=A0AAN4ZYD7_9RHOB|nr:bifunctional DedA family/phosphatase PAP2 family protein [Allgaiera indica]KDB03690.1 hypothetical protein U879_10580 [Defluviimonas sp. 20V17]GHD99858.1 hypothetical protein GCM10008024_09260 [Allgaiera indica]SDW41910.1 undecaprenyl-diphosphatase [Allgaiera indica]
MPHSLDQLLPSLQSLGAWSYWIIGLGSMLEAFFLTGVVVPGTLAVDAAGILAQRGFLNVFDLFWFVAIGSILGGELGYWTGRWGSRRIFTHFDPGRSRAFRRAQDLFERRGGLALVLGRLLGPVAGFVPLAAAVAGMAPRRFRIWNVIGALPYAAIHLSLGYFFGDIFARIGPAATRLALFAAAAAAILAVLAYMVVRIERHLPSLLSVAAAYLEALAQLAPVQAWRGRHPRLAAFLARRLDRGQFLGLPATLIALAFGYVLLIYLGSVLDFLMAAPIVQADKNIAALMHVFRNPLLIRLAAIVTAFGIWQSVSLVLVAALATLLLARRGPLAAGLAAAVAGNVVSVAVLKLAFHRTRPEFAYFVEGTNSFPSGHAAISVALYGMLAYIAWRLRLLGPITAALLALLAAFLIGLSRLYLIEHYLSDVLNGYLVGAMWLLIGISVAEWLQTRAEAAGAAPPGRAERAAKSPRRWLAPGMWALALLGSLWVSASYHKALTPPLAPEKIATVSDLPGFFAATGAPGRIDSIDGSPLAPVNLILVARDRDALQRALAAARYAPTEPATLSSILSAAMAEATGKPDPRAPAMPAFWNSIPSAMTYVAQVPPAGPQARAGLRHLLRVWPTRWRDAQGRQIFVATASFDDAQIWEASEQMDPHTDRDRDALVAALRAAGQVESAEPAPLPKADGSLRGHWQSDGVATVLILR